MIDQQKINEAVDCLVSVYSPLAIYLFGSYAWGNPNENSDLDFLVIVDKSEVMAYRRPVAGYHALFNLKVPTDLIVSTKEEFEERACKVPTLFYKIKNEGSLVYGNL